VALYGVESAEYRELSAGKGLRGDRNPVTVTAAMRSRR
jgi:hypothetical protein